MGLTRKTHLGPDWDFLGRVEGTPGFTPKFHFPGRGLKEGLNLRVPKAQKFHWRRNFYGNSLQFFQQVIFKPNFFNWG